MHCMRLNGYNRRILLAVEELLLVLSMCHVLEPSIIISYFNGRCFICYLTNAMLVPLRRASYKVSVQSSIHLGETLFQIMHELKNTQI